jgi:hypothetical protein
MIDETFNLQLIGEPKRARLMPSIADSKKEERATSILLAVFRVVPYFAREVLSEVKAPSGKTAKIECFTEVSFKGKSDRQLRPDGLITIKQGQKRWTALIESKIGSSELVHEQVEQYLDLAKANGIDAVITISNQFVANPTFHPLKLSKVKTRTVGLFHFSWISLVSKAILIEANTGVNDPEQVFILQELVRYLEHDASGVQAFTRMGSGWKEVCSNILKGTQIRQGEKIVEDAICSWHQLMRYLSLYMSQKLETPVTWVLSATKKQNLEENLKADIKRLVERHRFKAKFNIPDTASDITLIADVRSRTLSFSMSLVPPTDKKKPTAAINWLTRQLKDLENYPVTISASWPRRAMKNSAALVAVIDEPKSLVPDNVSDLPRKLEVIMTKDLAKNDRFKGVKTFVDSVIEEFPSFYSKVGQELKVWVPRPPRIQTKEEDVAEDESNDEQLYYYYVSGAKKQIGPVGRNEVLEVAKNHQASGMKIWHEGLEHWTSFDEVFS